MRELIKKRLEEMQNLEDKSLLIDVVSNIFLELFDETERKYEALEKRVYEELPLNSAQYAVYSTVMPISRIDSGHAFLSPMLAEELEEAVFKTQDLSDALDKGLQPIIGTVFYETDYVNCEKPAFDGVVFDGAIQIGSSKYPFKCRLVKARRYLEMVENLYGIFIQNGINWTTINCAYLSKFFDIQLVSVSQPLPAKLEILQSRMTISLKEYDKQIKQGMIPVWNVDSHRMKGLDYSVPVGDGVNNEHYISTSKLGSEHGFLVDHASAGILDVRRERDIIVAVSPQVEQLEWELYRFRGYKERDVDTFPYPLLSNIKRDNFFSRMIENNGAKLKTRADVYGLINSFLAADDFEIESLTITDEKVVGETYDMNSFILDELRDPNYKRTLLLKFKTEDKDAFFAHDLLSFLTSEVQYCFPEFRCVGEII